MLRNIALNISSTIDQTTELLRLFSIATIINSIVGISFKFRKFLMERIGATIEQCTNVHVQTIECVLVKIHIVKQ